MRPVLGPDAESTTDGDDLADMIGVVVECQQQIAQLRLRWLAGRHGCQQVDRGAMSSFGASSLSTIIQMVANGLGITLLPELSLPFEVHDPRIALLRFAAPEPSRTVGLAWRRSSPRKRDFVELGKLLTTSRPPAAG